MFADTNWKAASAELMGTFFLVFFGVTSFISMSGNDMLLEGVMTLGLTVFVLVHILGPVSGCHLNPVITIPTFISGKIKQNDTIAYIVAQIIGATIGFITFKELKPETNPSDIDILIIALIGTTFFVASLLASYDPASIGATLFVVSITSFEDVNPGVSIGNMLALAIEGNANWAFYGIVGSLIGCGLGYSIKEKIIDN
jgi:glycerol uptake facilitator-like aquaporin|tara:strand:- start:371 stop:967 length:597 start_codon:yes stop_codon:yes gene_type:complete